MSDLRELLERVADRAPAPGPGFRDELRRRVAADQRARARRRAAALAVGVACAAAALAAGGVAAFGGAAASSVVDKTVSCPVPDKGGVNVVDLYAGLAGRVSARETNPSRAGVVAPGGNGLPYAGVQTRYIGRDGKPHELPWTVNILTCAKAAPIALSPAQLPRLATLTQANADFTRECWFAPTIVVRLRVQLTKGHATAARLAVRSGAKHRPVVYIDWTPKRIAVYAAGSCHIAP